METNAKGDLGAGARPVLPDLRITEWIRALGPAVTEQERRRLLGRVVDLLGLDALWTFMPVEDDLFVRDCVGPVPTGEESAAVIELLWRRLEFGRRVRGGVRGETIHPRDSVDPVSLAVVYRDDGGGLVMAARLRKGQALRRNGLELMAALGVALLSIDQASRVGERTEDRNRRRELLRKRLDRVVARAIREVLGNSGGDRLEAAALLGVEADRLEREIARLGLL